VSRRIVDGVPEGATIAVENLTNIRSRVRAKKANGGQRRLHSWSFAHLRACITYKAEGKGIRVEGLYLCTFRLWSSKTAFTLYIL